ncbi:MAG: hypothetical protein SAK29_27570 [Scytonema sp. PMC 1069.18]|nr:hypothetical protein [Scytonema sp. PMC 1069.18]MEC4885871.1 hypothetical protein [Scytonema sp. PMC 1070.18]
MASDRISQNLTAPDFNKDFEQVVIPDIYRHLQAENYQEALEIINNFYQTKANRDENNLLKHKCDSWTALIFEKQGRDREALSLYKSLAHVMGQNHTLFTYYQVDVARVLHKLGNNKEARIEIEKVLENSIDSSISDKLTALNLYIDILEDCHEKLEHKYQPLVKKLATELGMLREKDWSKATNLSQSVKELSYKNQEANKRYSRLLIELDQVEDDSQAEVLLRKYISQESVGYYRNLAMKELDEFVN